VVAASLATRVLFNFNFHSITAKIGQSAGFAADGFLRAITNFPRPVCSRCHAPTVWSMQDLPSARSHRGGAGREKIPFRENQPLQVIDFVETKFAILIVFEFFLMTAEHAENERHRVVFCKHQYDVITKPGIT